jgi:hypothetical protein
VSLDGQRVYTCDHNVSQGCTKFRAEPGDRVRTGQNRSCYHFRSIFHILAVIPLSRAEGRVAVKSRACALFSVASKRSRAAAAPRRRGGGRSLSPISSIRAAGGPPLPPAAFLLRTASAVSKARSTLSRPSGSSFVCVFFALKKLSDRFFARYVEAL